MPEIKVEIPNLEKFREALKKWPSISAPIINRAIRKSIYDIQAKTIVVTPHRTQRLRGSFQVAFGPLMGILRPTVEYAIWVHEGTRPHIIRPVNAKALFWKGADHPVASVKHPGTRPNRFMVAGVAAAQQTVIQNFSNALNEIVRKVAGQI